MSWKTGQFRFTHGYKQPILLSQHHSLTKLIVESCHKRVLHGGVRETLAELRSKFWICKGRQLVKKILRGCTTCRRFLAKPFQAMVPGMLPESPCIMCVQYIGGCSVHRGVFSTSGGYHEYIWGIP